MGTTTILDIIASTMFAGVLFLMVMRSNGAANEASTLYQANLILQENLTTIVAIIEEDFRKIGYCRDWRLIPEPTNAMRIADSNRIRFWADIDNDGHLDSVTYTLGATSELSETPNPRDRYLIRQVNNGTAAKISLGLTQFSLKYYDALNDYIPFPITQPRMAYYIQISIALETAFPQSLKYTVETDTSGYVVYWKQIRLVTKNLRNR